LAWSDLFRIPKYSYWWHVSELTTPPMAYIVRVDDTQAAVFSNCEQVRLLQDEGQGWEEAATKGPETMFLSPSGQPISYALKHPPFQFTVAAMATALRAEGLIGGNTIATNEWRRYGTPVALQLEADRPVITADGADLSRIIVTAVDTNGTPVELLQHSHFQHRWTGPAHR